MHVLLTNDDGIHATGLHVLEAAARSVFDRVTVVAPAGEMSGVSHSLSLHRPLRFHDHGEERYSVDGTPVDCVFAALSHVMAGNPPDLVLSGVNHGPNVGFDVLYSGTVAGAREAVVQGVPGVALSLTGRQPGRFTQVARALRQVVAWLRAHQPPAGVVWNINLPAVDVATSPSGDYAPRPMLATRLGRRTYGNEIVSRKDPRGRPYYWIGGANPVSEPIDGTDCEMVARGHISITPLQLDTTDLGQLESLTRRVAATPTQEPT